VAAQPGDYSKDTYQETQVLYGDLLSITQEQGDWYEVNVLDQLIYDVASATFKPYPGWIKKQFVLPITSLAPANITVIAQTTNLLQAAYPGAQVMATLSVGTLLAAVGPSTAAGLQEVRLQGGGSGWVAAKDVQQIPTGTPTVSRAMVIARAERFLGSTYLWGGYSAPLGDAYQMASTGVDCSGLSGLAYRSLGVHLPHNARNQLRYTQPIPLGDLERGDLVFASSTNGADGVSHVLIFDEGEQLIESSSQYGVTRWTTFNDKYGFTRQELHQRGGQVSSTSYLLASRIKGVTWVP
jgi:cell wall-associated NlpC family hydrolase